MTANIFIMRHGDATLSIPDYHRSLSEYGVKQVLKSVDFISSILGNNEINEIYTSPYVRAKQTAELVRSKINCKEIIEEQYLTPNGAYSYFIEYLNALDLNAGNYVVVSHLPCIGLLCSELINSHISFNTGTVVYLTTEGNGKYCVNSCFSPRSDS